MLSCSHPRGLTRAAASRPCRDISIHGALAVVFLFIKPRVAASHLCRDIPVHGACSDILVQGADTARPCSSNHGSTHLVTVSLLMPPSRSPNDAPLVWRRLVHAVVFLFTGTRIWASRPCRDIPIQGTDTTRSCSSNHGATHSVKVWLLTPPSSLSSMTPLGSQRLAHAVTSLFTEHCAAVSHPPRHSYSRSLVSQRLAHTVILPSKVWMPLGSPNSHSRLGHLSVPLV